MTRGTVARLLRRAIVVSALAAGAFAPVAMASGSASFYPGNIPHEVNGYPYAYASGGAHTYVNGIETRSDHTACPARSSGFGGLAYAGPGTGYFLEWSSTNCGYGVVSWFPTGVNVYTTVPP